MLDNDQTITKIDIKNAFNSINQDVIIFALQNRGCSPLAVNYISKFMKFRFCKLIYDPKKDPLIKRATAGVP